MSTGGIVLVALAIAVGLVGIVVPLLPGTLLVFGAIAVWAVLEHSVTSWVTLGVVAAGASTSKQVADVCGAGSQCGRCRRTVRAIISSVAQRDTPP